MAVFTMGVVVAPILGPTIGVASATATCLSPADVTEDRVCKAAWRAKDALRRDKSPEYSHLST
jgi:hypothetical protein